MGSIDLGSSWKGSKDGYIQNYFQARQSYSQILSQVTSYADPRINLMTEFIISSITDDHVRYEMYELKKKLHAERIRELDDPTETEKAEALASVCLYMLGEITSWYDEFLGITNSQTYDVIGKAPDEENPPEGWNEVESTEEVAEHA